MDLNQVFELPPIHYDLAKARAIVLVNNGANLSEINDMGYPLRRALISEVAEAVRPSLASGKLGLVTFYGRHANIGAVFWTQKKVY
ncbi:MAG: hypothetical protein H0U75_03700 [Legionella sp.]|nr:hypothetical protein [Legionella sp.]